MFGNKTMLVKSNWSWLCLEKNRHLVADVVSAAGVFCNANTMCFQLTRNTHQPQTQPGSKSPLQHAFCLVPFECCTVRAFVTRTHPTFRVPPRGHFQAGRKESRLKRQLDFPAPPWLPTHVRALLCGVLAGAGGIFLLWGAAGHSKRNVCSEEAADDKLVDGFPKMTG